MVVNNVIRTLMAMTVEDQRVDHDWLGETVGRCLGVFYVNNDMVGSRDPDWLQNTMNVLVGLFRRYGLATNVDKSHTMTCQPSALRAGMPEEAMALKCTGVGELYWVRLQKMIPCPECGFELTTGSTMAHCHRMHRTETAIDWSWLPHQPQVYDTSFLRSTN